ncbi:DNA-directed DNA polymerase alpha catalytic subunit pol1 [Chytridiales sp. JEL 0842]|nr:DNA-directed DNA polymerase alpha catalytic subunit pol1 [Chytridiales sp. JEL 0842]
MSSRSSRRAGKGEESRQKQLEKLKRIRETGESALSAYEVKEDKAIYEEVTDADYNAIMQKRMEEDDFVVDDDGRGYADYGNDFGDDNENESESEAEEDDTAAGKRKRAKKGKDAKKPKKVRPEARVTSFFQKAQAKAAATASAAATAESKPPSSSTSSKQKKKEAAPIVDEQDILADIFNDIDAEVAEHDRHRGTFAEPEAASFTMESAYQFTPAPTSPLRTAPLVSRKEENHFEHPIQDFDSQRTTLSKADDEATDSPSQSKNVNGGESVEEDDQIKSQDSATSETPSSDKPKSKPAAAEKEPGFEIKSLDSKKRTIASSSGFLPKFQAPPPTAKPQAISSTAAAAGCKSWTSVADEFAVVEAAPSQAAPMSSSQYVNQDFFEPDGTLLAYWFDAFEKDGTIYMFCKVFNKREKKHVTCCLTVEGMMRVMFVLPRAKKFVDNTETDIEVTMKDVYDEVDGIRSKYHIQEFFSRPVSRKYAFEIPGIPAESDYLKIAYSYKKSPLPQDISGATFSRIFGTNTGALETFLIKRKLMGPCWIEISNATISNKNVSWTRLEMTVPSPKNVKVLSESDERHPNITPPFTAMSISLRTVMNHQKNANEVVAVSVLIFDNVTIDGATTPSAPTSYTAIRQLTDIPIPVGFMEMVKKHRENGRGVEVHKNEKGLLHYLLAIIHRNDPDILVGHNFIGVDLDILLHRMKANQITLWSKLGRLRRTKWPKLQSGAGGTGDSTFQERQVTAGRIICDTFMSSKEYIMKVKSYTLTNMAMTQLQIAREDLDIDNIPKMFWDAHQMMHLLKHCETDCILTARLMFKIQVLPLTKQLTNLAGNLWSRTILAGSRADRNEFLLLHEFHNKKYIVPDKMNRFSRVTEIQADDDDDDEMSQPKKSASSKRKPAYAGGLVLEPKKGFYDKFVLMLDFNSLYPSIIQEFNICFTTVERSAATADDAVPEPPEPDVPMGILPKLLATLVERRRAVKSLMKDPKLSEAQYSEFNIRQQALKLTANSMYGCLGFAHSRFYAKPLAMLVTQRGREILQSTVDLAGQEKLEVIYGDTDSIMIYTNTENAKDVIKIGQDFKRAVNKRYRLLEIEIDGLFRKMLLLKKKKYAALIAEEKDGKTTYTLEKKGLDIVRRDWCGLSHEVSEFVLQKLFSDDARDEMLSKVHDFLTKVGEDVRNGSCPLEKFVINKGLTKNPEDYADVKNQPHVQVALAMKAKGTPARVGDTIPYVICVGGTGGLASRAQHPDELRKPDSTYKIDYDYYLANQVLPPVDRLLSPIEGTDQARIATCLGLDAAKFQVTSSDPTAAEEDLYTLESTISDEERFKHVEKWSVTCCHCREKHVFEGLVRFDNSQPVSGLICPNPDCNAVDQATGEKTPMDIASLTYQLMSAMRQHVRQYMNGCCVCDERACATKTRAIAVFGRRCQMPGCKGTLVPEMTDAMLSTQMLYFDALLDPERIKKKYERGVHRDAVAVLAGNAAYLTAPMREAVQRMISRNARRFVNLGNLFDSMALAC